MAQNPAALPVPDPADSLCAGGAGGSVDVDFTEVTANLQQLIDLLVATDPDGNGIINVEAMLDAMGVLDEVCYREDDGNGGYTFFKAFTLTDGSKLATNETGDLVDVTAGIPATWELTSCAKFGCQPADPATQAQQTGFGSITVEGPADIADPSTVVTISADMLVLESLTLQGILGTVTITDSFGNVSKLRAGQTKSADFGERPPGPITVTVPFGTEFDYFWTEPIL